MSMYLYSPLGALRGTDPLTLGSDELGDVYISSFMYL